jgi:hypothetical protein
MERLFMTVEEFFAELERVHERFEWNLRPEPHTPERRWKPRLVLRAHIGGRPRGVIFDPLGAVCYALTGKPYKPQEWPSASEALGMRLSDSAVLVNASNDNTHMGPDGAREPIPELIEFRLRMFEAVCIIHREPAAREF